MAGWDVGQIERIVQSVVQAALTSAASSNSRNASRTHASRIQSQVDGKQASPDRQQNNTARLLRDIIAVSPEARRQLAEAMLRELSRALALSTVSAVPNSQKDTAAAAAADAARKSEPQNISPQADRATSAAVSGTKASPPPPAEAVTALLSNPEMRDELAKLFAQPEIRLRIPQLLRDPSLQEPLLRLLQNESFAPVARAVFSDPDAAPLIRLLLSEPSTQPDTLALLNQGKILDRALPALVPLPNLQALKHLAALSDGQGLIVNLMKQNPSIRIELMRAAGKVDDPKAVAQFFSRPEVQNLVQDILSRPETARPLFDLLNRPELATPRDQILSKANIQASLPALLASPKTQPLLLKALEGIDPQTLLRIANRKDIQTAITLVIASSSEPESIAQSLRFLSQIDSPRIASAILGQPEIQAKMPELIQMPQVREAMVQMLQQSNMANVMEKALVSPRMMQQINQMMSDPKTQAFVLQMLSTPRGVEAAQRAFADPAVFKLVQDVIINSALNPTADADPVPAALRLLSEPRMASHLESLLANRQVRDTLPSLLRGKATRDAALHLLAIAAGNESTRSVLSSAEVQKSLRQILDSSPDISLPAAFLRDDNLAPIMLDLLQNMQNRKALNLILQQAEIQAQLANLLREDATRAATFEILKKLGPSPLLGQILSRPDVQSAMLGMIKTGQNLTELRQLLQFPEMQGIVQELFVKAGQMTELSSSIRGFLFPLLANINLSEANGQLASGKGIGDPEVAQSQLRRMLGPGLMPAEAILENPLTASALVSRLQSSRFSLSDLQSPGFENLRLVLQRMFGPLSSLAANGLGMVESKTLQFLEKNLLHLYRTSPARAESALETLGLLARLGGRNLNIVLQQIAEKLGRMSAALALKGGLPAHLREPLLAETSLLMLRFENLPGDSFVSLTRHLMSQGVEITFIGRDSAGAAQMQIQMAEPSAASPERTQQSNSQPFVHLANLRSGEATDFFNLFGQSMPGSGRENGPIQYLYNYQIAPPFAWSNPAMATSSIIRKFIQFDDKDAIPSFLDLIADDPLLLPYYPNEILIPGTNIPLILPREIDNKSASIVDAEVLPD